MSTLKHATTTTADNNNSTATGGTTTDRVEWSRATILGFIEDYRSQRVLWDPNTKGYHIKQTKYEALKSLGLKYGAEIRSIRSKIKSLRSSFHREHGKVINGRRKGVHYQPMWFAYEAIRFILDGETQQQQQQQQRQQQNDDEEEEADAENAQADDESGADAESEEKLSTHDEQQQQQQQQQQTAGNNDVVGIGAEGGNGKAAAAGVVVVASATNGSGKQQRRERKRERGRGVFIVNCGVGAGDSDLEHDAYARCGAMLRGGLTAAQQQQLLATAATTTTTATSSSEETRDNALKVEVNRARNHANAATAAMTAATKAATFIPMTTLTAAAMMRTTAAAATAGVPYGNAAAAITAADDGINENHNNNCNNIAARVAAAFAAAAAAAAAANSGNRTFDELTALTRSDLDGDMHNYCNISADDVKTELIESDSTDLAMMHALATPRRISTPTPAATPTPIRANRKRKAHFVATQFDDVPTTSKQQAQAQPQQIQQHSMNLFARQRDQSPAAATTATSAAANTAGNTNTAGAFHTKSSTSQNDEYGVFGEYVAITIRKLKTSKAKIVVKHLINNLLYEAELGKYDHGIAATKEPPQLYKM